MTMWRGTTPTHTFTLPDGMTGSEFEVIYITYSQNSHAVLEKEKSQMLFSGNEVIIHLTQKDTLCFEPGPVKIQLRARLPDGQAVASNIISTTAREILKDGEI